MKYQALLILPAIALFSSNSTAQVLFNFDYSGSSESLWTPAARRALETAASNVSAYLPGYSTTITMKANGTNTANGSLASAGSTLSPKEGFNNIGTIGTRIQTSSALVTTSGTISVNFANNWSFTDIVAGNQYDFVNVMMHELGHALGFISYINWDGSSSIPWATAFSRLDNFLMDENGAYLVDHSSFETGTAWEAARTNGIYFMGSNAMVANGGAPVPIYTPSTWQDGSSGSHLDTDFYTGDETKLMNHAVGTGIGERAFSDLEIAMFRDIGYATFTAPIPEPCTGFLLIFTAGIFLRRKRESA